MATRVRFPCTCQFFQLGWLFGNCKTSFTYLKMQHTFQATNQKIIPAANCQQFWLDLHAQNIISKKFFALSHNADKLNKLISEADHLEIPKANQYCMS